jgi:rhamnulokinase
VQAMATGDIKSLAEARVVVRASFDVRTYEPRHSKQWEQAYERFRGVLEAR